ncbi:MAG TPA: bifunctional transaldolase/phosoglucose isomerase [Aliidongia sp.]|nr:bifunctional transaldolase/phosoglucose isomerase [Aliidongia sp.]
MNPLKQLEQYGQSVWLDFMRRNLIGAELDKLIREDGLKGITSNPSIFEKAIGHSADYDGQFAELTGAGDMSAGSLYEALAIHDIQMAADALRPTYDATKKRDGYISLEVSPYLANDTEATIAEARRLWQRVGKPNLMVKVPGTKAGIPAIEQLISEGININVTLLFAEEVYAEVAEAYITGLERYVRSHGDLGHIASVASFFISRIDTLADKEIDAKGGAATQLKGKIAIANAKLTYQRYKQLFGNDRWAALAKHGAQTQRLLWASTGTKNPAYSDVLYVEELIGADTVNTMPVPTMDAFRDHGKPRNAIEENVAAAQKVMDGLAQAGISMAAITAKLVEDGVQLFADAFDQLLGAVEGKRVKALGGRLNGMTVSLPDPLKQQVEAEIEAWRHGGKIRRLWAKDSTLWTGADENKWLGWLGIVEAQQKELPALQKLSEEAKRYGSVLLLGMGGSSLGPEVLGETFGHLPNRPALHVLDSTDPTQIRAFQAKIDLADTLFIVSSKSGGTLEPNILKQYFFDQVEKKIGKEEAGKRFVAVTDPGSKMQQVAERDHFSHIFMGEPTIGGRYSVLSAFGTVPAAAMGLDLDKLLKTTQIMERACGPDVPPALNPGLQLGVVLGVAANHGRDKVTILTGPGLEDFGAWAEQLLAESTGKVGKGLIPVDAEPIGDPAVYGKDRVFVYLSLAGKTDPQATALADLERSGQPVVRITLADTYQIGQEFFRWEIATAVAGSVLGIHTFNQPDVEESKIATRKLTEAYEESGKLPPETPILEGDGFRLYADARNTEALASAAKGKTLEAYLKAHFDRIQPGDYAGLLAYVQRSEPTIELMRQARLAIRNNRKVATCVGFGPRFLHSTGQAYKGGPNSGVFLQITCDDPEDLAVPGQKYTFGIVKAAQARGDFDVLAARGRRALRVHLTGSSLGGSNLVGDLEKLLAAIRSSLA